MNSIIDEKDIYKAINTQNRLNVLFFYADWCHICDVMEPVMDNLSKKYDNMSLLKINAERFMDISIEYHIKNVPTFIFMYNGMIIDRRIGITDKFLLEKIIKKNI